MRRILGLAAASALMLAASAASAEEVTGKIEEIDLTRNTFVIEDKVFTASPQNTVGPTLEELKEGDEVTVSYQDDGSGTVMNATTITKAE